MIIRFSVLMAFLVLSSSAFGQDIKVYDDHGRRDPFGPLVSSSGAVIVYDSDLTSADMNLEGVLADASGQNLAIINGKVVKLGDHVGLFVVDVIAQDHVELIKDQERFTLKLNKKRL